MDFKNNEKIWFPPIRRQRTVTKSDGDDDNEEGNWASGLNESVDMFADIDLIQTFPTQQTMLEFDMDKECQERPELRKCCDNVGNVVDVIDDEIQKENEDEQRCDKNMRDVENERKHRKEPKDKDQWVTIYIRRKPKEDPEVTAKPEVIKKKPKKEPKRRIVCKPGQWIVKPNLKKS